MRDSSTSLGMTKIVSVAILALFASICTIVAQEMPTPSATSSPSPLPTATPTPTRSVRISFLPPPLEGTISLGIYDGSGKLVRVLVQEGDVDEFEVGPDALVMKWDGKNDHEEDLPAGKYHARGYMVGRLKVEDLGQAETPPKDAPDHVQVKLVSNPLSKEARLNVDLAVGFAEEKIFLKTTDGLPLFSVIEAPELVSVGITKSGEKAVDILVHSGAGSDSVRVSNIDKMMAFDCGEFELK